MPPTFDAASEHAGGTTDSLASMTWTHTPVGTPSAVTVHVTNNGTSDAATATYGGVAMTLAGTANGPGDQFSMLFTLLNPPAGAQTVFVDFAGTPWGHGMAITYLLARGFGAAVTASGTSAAASVTVPSNANAIVADVMCLEGVTGVSTQTLRHTKNFGSAGSNNSGYASTAAGAASVVMGYTHDSVGWSIIGISIEAGSGNQVVGLF